MNLRLNTLALGLAIALGSASAHGQMGQGAMMGPGAVMGPGYGQMGPGMMGYGPGYSQMGPGYGHMGQMGPGMMMGPGYGHMGQMGPGMMMGPGYGHMGQMGPGMMMGPGYGHMGQMGPGMMMGPGYGHMGQMGPGMIGYGSGGITPLLDEAQREKMRELMEAHWPGQIERMNQMRELQAQMIALMQQERPDADELSSMNARMAELHGKMMLERLGLHNAMQDLLTDEQRQQLYPGGATR
ncbi:Spy/CpxP family protein refolding chaperone [Halomonas aquatica]|uniref:Spy/CpxP family protein refolding chaperone n=1 Tax=Halomonas aquatica TaxID=3151123 RepID=A0ABV1NGN5_9GAMM